MNDFFLNSDRVKELWQKVKAYVGKYGDGLYRDEDILKVDNPVRGVYTQKEFNALSEEEKASGTYFVDDGSSSGGGSTEIYSTEETRIGTWIDGKPLYRRVYITTSPSRYGTYDDKILDLDENIYVWKIDGILIANPEDGSLCPVNFAHGGTAYIACWFKSNLHCIDMMVGVAAQVSRPVYLYLTYTKTTDPEVSA